jgi:HSP20 family protein
MNALMKPRFGMMEDFRKEVDQLMSRFFNGSEEEGIAYWTPRANLAETEDGYHVSLDLPGLKPEDFSVELRHGDLWITGQRNEEHEESGKTWHRIERHFGQFRRVIRLGDDVNPEGVSAEYKDGVLRIHIPKSETAKSRKIEVKS